MSVHYDFPSDITLEQVKQIVDNSDGHFILVDKGEYIVANYVLSGKETHPTINGVESAIRRELRGLIFNKEGFVLSRPYHKFFNYGEREDLNIDLNKDFVVLEKLDGSMIRPIKIADYWRMASKMGITDVSMQVEEYLANSKTKANYIALIDYLLKMELTPIFEWCSNKQKIVIDYPEDRLVLTAIRNNYTGEYLSVDTMIDLANRYDIDCVRVVASSTEARSNFPAFIDKIKAQEGTEGVVLRFIDGHMVKIKSDLYVELHNAKTLLNNERTVVGIILNEQLDDLIPLLSKEEQARIQIFSDELWKDIFAFVHKVNYILLHIKDKSLTRRDFACNPEFSRLDNVTRSQVFTAFTSTNTYNDVLNNTINFIKHHLSTNKSYDQCTFIKAKWN